MKKLNIWKILLLGLAIFLARTYAQGQNIAITDDNGYAPDASAMLDIKSTSKGLLIPRLDSLQRVNIASPATGLLVFDTDDNAFFYFDGSDWLNLSSKVVNPAVSNLNTALFSVVNNVGDTVFAVYPEGVVINVGDGDAKGNRGGFAVGGLSSGGKAPATDFMKMDPINYFIGHESGGKNTSGEYNSFFGYKSGIANTTGNNNNFIGYRSGWANTAGNNNSFNGYEAGFKNDTGSFNVFSGYKSGWSNTSGNYNTFIGYQAGFENEEGNENLFLGYKSGFNTTTGSTNIFFGYESGYSNQTGNGNVMIGYQAGYSETGSNKLYIHNTNADSASSLIYGEFDNSYLQLNADVKTTGTTTMSEFFTLERDTIVVTAGGTITPTKSYHVLSASGNTSLSATTAIADGTEIGQVLILEGSDAYYVYISDGANTSISSATMSLNETDIAMFIWNGQDWLEITRNNNE